MTNKKYVYLAPLLVVVMSTLVISACSESDNSAANGDVEKHATSMFDEAKDSIDDVAAESAEKLSQTASSVVEDVKANVESKAEALIVETKSSVAKVSDEIAEEAAQAVAVVSDKVAAVTEPAKGATLFKSKGCAGCHGANAMGGIGPRLAGQHEEYLIVQFKLIRDGKRASGQAPMMSGAVKSVTDAEITDIAGYLTAL